MDATGIAYLALALAAVAAAIMGFFALFGKGPRGTVLSIAAGLFVWGAMIPLALGDPDYGTISRELDLLAAVLRLCGLVGGILGVFDLFQRRPPSDEWVAEWVLRQPLLWGGAACLAFYELLVLGVIDQPLAMRYFASHPVEYVTTALFFVGLAALVIRYLTVISQFISSRRFSLDPVPAGGQHVADCDYLLGQLAELPRSSQHSYLVSRLRDALEFVRRKGSADALDQHLRHLEDLDVARMQAGYSVVRIVIWAIPILGFLGTVIGITLAIANLSPQALEQSLPEVTSGLGVAFDTTALALALSIVLMFAKFWVERTEDRLLAAVDAQVSAELVGRFQDLGTDGDPNVASIRRMSQHVLEGVEAMAARQAEVWKATIDETHQQWAEVSLTAGKVVKDSLATTLTETLDRHAKVLSEEVSKHADRLSASASQHGAKLDHSAQQTAARLRDGLEKLAELLVEALARHGEVLTASEKELAEENRRHLAEVEAALGEAMVVAADRQEQLIRQSEKLLAEMQAALVEAAGATVRQQEQLVKQGDVLLQVVDATGQVKKLEDTLNQNLDALRRAHSFEDVVLSLSAAIQLLGARLGSLPASTSAVVDTAGGKPASQAA